MDGLQAHLSLGNSAMARKAFFKFAWTCMMITSNPAKGMLKLKNQTIQISLNSSFPRDSSTFFTMSNFCKIGT